MRKRLKTSDLSFVSSETLPRPAWIPSISVTYAHGEYFVGSKIAFRSFSFHYFSTINNQQIISQIRPDWTNSPGMALIFGSYLCVYIDNSWINCQDSLFILKGQIYLDLNNGVHYIIMLHKYSNEIINLSVIIIDIRLGDNSTFSV